MLSLLGDRLIKSANDTVLGVLYGDGGANRVTYDDGVAFAA